MNKYLIVVIYIVAGCAVAVPMGDIGFSDVSSDILAEFSELTDTDTIANTQIPTKHSKTAVAAVVMDSANGEIHVTSLFSLEKNTLFDDYLFYRNDDNGLIYRSVLFVESKNTSEIQIRGPGLC